MLKYNDWVIINSGFYEGMQGRVIEISGYYSLSSHYVAYTVELVTNNDSHPTKTVLFAESRITKY